MFMLHVQFFVRNIISGTDEVNFFGFTIRYLFDKEIAIHSLFFALSCMLVFAGFYLAGHGLARTRRRKPHISGVMVRYRLPLWPLIIVGASQVIVTLVVVIKSGFVYQVIAEEIESYSFILELRIVFLLLLSHLLLNVRLSEIVGSPRYRMVRWVTLLYIIALVLMQARSRAFEVIAVLAFTHLIWEGDRLKIKYILPIGFALIVPNIIVLGRLGRPDNLEELVKGLFSFEYTVLFNNLLSAAITNGPNLEGGLTFMSSAALILPSPIRAMLGLEVVKSDYYQTLSDSANVGNGGFSLLAELYSNFGWYAVLVLGFMGLLLGSMNARAMRVGYTNFLASTAPLLYSAFILAFRNDLGVFIKYSIQLLVVAVVLSCLASLSNKLPNLSSGSRC
jgi:hypothetical protein